MLNRASVRVVGLVFLLLTIVTLISILFWRGLLGVQQPRETGERAYRVPKTSPQGIAFVVPENPVLRRASADFVEYELLGRFDDVPKENAKGEYAGTFTVVINGEAVRVPVLLGPGDLSTFIGLHSGTTVTSPSKYEIKTVGASIPLIALKVQKQAIIRVKTRIIDRQDNGGKPCNRYCQYLRGWVSAYGNESETFLDSLINASPEKLSRNLSLFIVQVGFLEAQ